MKIYLIRHGETTGDVENRFGGDYEDHLSQKGIRQAKELALKLRDKSIQRIYYSPRIRAMETAKIVNKELGVESEVVDGLRERNNYGILTGMIKTEAGKKYPEEIEKLKKGGFHHDITGSEEYGSFRKRIVNAFEKIINKKGYDTITIISHGGPISCIVREVLKKGEFKKLGDCAILEINKEGKKLSLVALDNASLEERFS